MYGQINIQTEGPGDAGGRAHHAPRPADPDYEHGHVRLFMHVCMYVDASEPPIHPSIASPAHPTTTNQTTPESTRTAFYATLVLSQFVHVFVCKTRFVPMLEHGVFNNSMMNYG